ncbi:MAG: GNAT family N-acetyltransferase [Deltaproteobacteria bacterium]
METLPAVSVRRFRADEWQAYRQLRLRALADAPDAFGSTLEVEGAKPDEYWADRLSFAAHSPAQLLLMAELGAERVGLALGVIGPAEPELAQVFQMWVAPPARGRGCATVLLDTLLAWARDANAKSVALRVTCGDTPARRLYERAGFTSHGDPEPLRPDSTARVQAMTLTF